MAGMSISEMEEMARKCRVEICKMTHRAQAGHPGGSLSEIDILWDCMVTDFELNLRPRLGRQRSIHSFKRACITRYVHSSC